METKKNGSSADKPTISVSEAAKILGMGPNKAYDAARAGEIPCIKIGKRYLVLREPFERMLRGQWRPAS